MRQALGNAFITNIVITFVVILIAVVISSLSYSKAFKVKNMIIETIEENGGFNNNTRTQIDENLSSVGYRINRNSVQNCEVGDRTQETALNTSNNYRYCVVEKRTIRGIQYRVTAYMYFDLPVIGNNMEFPIHGETRIFYDRDSFN